MGVPCHRSRLTRRLTRGDSLLVGVGQQTDIQTRQKACVGPWNHLIEQMGVGHSESTPVESGAAMSTPDASSDTETGSHTLSEAVRPSRVG